MAAAVLNHLGKGKYIASSAGISAFNGDSISDDAIIALQNAGIPSTEDNDYKNHFSRAVSEWILQSCDKIVAISSRHLFALFTAFPEHAEKMSAMPKDISDPYMLGRDEYEKCLSEITECIKEMFSL
jgi:protein-tyrosine-phosphatase